MASKLGNRLRELMDQKGVSLERLAEAGGIEPDTLRGILGGEIVRPPDERLRGFAELLDVSFESLLELIPEEARRAEAAFDRMACAAHVVAGQAPDWIQLFPLGEVVPMDGRPPWTLRDAEAVVRASRAVKDALPIDYDHQTDFTKETGGNAPAAGWIRELVVRQDGIWGRVDWTERGRAAVAGKEYRFISPVFNFDRNRVVTRILRAGLTNDPALNLKALASREGDHRGVGMEELLKTLAKALGLPEDADEKAVCTAVTDLVEKTKGKDKDKDKGDGEGKALASVAKALGLKEDASAEDIEQAAAKATADAAKAGDRDDLAKRLAKIEEDTATKDAEEKAEAAIKAGKLIPAQRDWAVAYAKRDSEGFDAFVEKQPVIVVPGGDGGGGGMPAAGSDGLTEQERAVCTAMGLKPEDFKKTKDGEKEETS